MDEGRAHMRSGVRRARVLFRSRRDDALARRVRLDDEGGAVAPFVAVLVVLLVGLASFAVDLGYQRVAARDMQAVADIVALDMARELDGTSSGNQLKNRNSWQTALRESLARNDDSAVGDPLEAVPCNYNLNTLPSGKAVICATPGVYNPTTKVFSSGGGNTPATHVRVVTRTRIDYFFPVYANDGWVTKTAYADAPDTACVKVGSYAARLDTGDSPLLGFVLGRLLGSNIELGVLDWNGIAAVDVNLLDLIGVETSVGTVGALLEGDKLVSLHDFYVATLGAVQAGGGNLAAVGLLNQLIDIELFKNLQIKLAELIDLGNKGAAGLDADVNLLDLVTAAAQVANGENSVAIPAIGIDLGPLAQVTGSVHVTEAPKIGCRGGTATTSQVAVDVNAKLLDLDLSLGKIDLGELGNLNLSVAKTKVTADIDLDVAPASAKILHTSCVGNKTVTAETSTGLLSWTITVNPDISVLFETIPVVKGPIVIKGTAASGGEKTKIITKDADYDVPVQLGQGSIGAPNISIDVSQLKILGIKVGKPAQWVLDLLLKGIVNPLVATLDTWVLNPLLSFLGLDVSGAEMYVVREPNCGVPGLRG